MRSRRIALLGFGEVGSIFATDLAARGHDDITVYDPELASAHSKQSAAAAGLAVKRCGSAADAADGAYLVISAVTASSAVTAAEQAAAGVGPGAYYFDINSCSPDAKISCAEAIERSGGRFVEAVVMTPIAPRRMQSPMLLGGPHARTFLEEAADLDLKADIVSEEIGVAAASKLCRSVIVKGMEALVTEALLAARQYGVENAVIASLTDLMPHQNWRQFARYMIGRSIEHGARRAEEMNEAAITVEQAGVDPVMCRAIAQRQAQAAQWRDALGSPDLYSTLDAVLGVKTDSVRPETEKEAKAR